jgi:uncharacterized LabA/DUF88 family protein
MRLQFVKKHLKKNDFTLVRKQSKTTGKNANDTDMIKNKRNKKKTDMDIREKIEAAEEVMNSIAPEVKVVKKDRGLIERTESSKIILTEDNRQVLND